MDDSEFYEKAMQPGFPDELAIQIERPEGDPPEMTFSEEAFESIGKQAKHFAMARALAHHRANGGFGPKKLRVTMKLDYAPGDPNEDAGPFYHLIDGEARKL